MQNGFITAKTEIKNKFTSENETITPDNLSEIPDSAPVDLRPLAVRLAESERIKEEEFGEKVRLANTLRGLDQDELDFLAQVSEKKKQMEILEKKQLEKELKEFKNAKETVLVKSLHKSIQKSVISQSLSKPVILIKRKSEKTSQDSKKSLKIVEYSDSD